MCNFMLFEERYDCLFGLAEAMPITTAINKLEQEAYVAKHGSSVPAVTQQPKRNWKSRRPHQYHRDEVSAKAIMDDLVTVDNAS